MLFSHKILYTNIFKKEVSMKLLSDLWDHLKEWSDWSMKDWIKAGDRDWETTFTFTLI